MSLNSEREDYDGLADLIETQFGEVPVAALEIATRGMVQDLLAKDGTTWGAMYLADCHQRAVKAFKDIAEANPLDTARVIECQNAIRDYKRVVEFTSNWLRQFAGLEAAEEMAGGPDLEDGPGGMDGG